MQSEMNATMQNEAAIVQAQDRRLFLGGSDIASIFGVSPWKSAYELWEEKTAQQYIAPLVEPDREKLYRRGKKLEPWVLELLEEERGIFVQKRNQRYLDDEYPFMACEIDFEYMDSGGMCNGDVKTISPFAAGEWGAEDTDEIPVYYCLQFLWGLMIKRRQKCLVAAMIGADDLRVYQVLRDDELIAEMRRRAIEFWQLVTSRTPPPPQCVSDTNKILIKYGGFVTAGTDEVWLAIRRLRGLRAAQKRLKAAEEDYELEVKRYLAIEAEAAGLNTSPKKFVINDVSGKKMASLCLQHRAGYTVKECDFLVLRTS